MMGRNAAFYRRMQGGIRGRSLCILLGQSRSADRRNRDSGKSPAEDKAARIHTVVRNIHHNPDKSFEIILYAVVVIRILRAVWPVNGGGQWHVFLA